MTAIDEVDNGLTMYDAQRRRLEDLGGAVAAARQALDLATQRYDRGIIDYLNVLDAQRELYALQDEQAISENAAVSDFVDAPGRLLDVPADFRRRLHSRRRCQRCSPAFETRLAIPTGR